MKDKIAYCGLDCDSFCSIHQCALKKGVATCGDCPEMEKRETLGMIISNSPDALKNLKR